MQQPVFAAIDVIEFPELHDESIPVMGLYMKTQQLLRASGIREFGLKDLYKPEAQIVKRNLSAVINFAKYREEKLLAYTELQEEYEGLVTASHRLEEERDGLLKRLQEMEEERARELPDVGRVEAEIEGVYGENQALNKQQSVLSGEVKELKHELNVLAEEGSVLKMKLSGARGMQEELKGQIVHSPEKIKGMLEDIAAAVDHEKMVLEESDKRARDVASRLDAATKLEKEVSKAVCMMREADAEVGKKKEVSKRVKALRAEVASLEHEAVQLEATKQHLQRQHASLFDRIDRLKSQCQMKKQVAEGRMEEQLRHKEAIEAGNAAALAKLHENEAAIRALEERAAELRESHESQIGEVLGQYHSLREAVAKYQEEMDAAMRKLDEDKEQGVTDTYSITQSLLEVR